MKMKKIMALHRGCRTPRRSQAIQAIKSGIATYSTSRMVKKIATAVILITLAAPASAQVIYYPWISVTTTQTGGTIATGATFQTALTANTGRKACLIQNTSSHIMDVFVGALADATAAKSIQVAAAGTFTCNYGPAVLTGAINVTTSASSDTFVVLSAQ